MDGLDIVNLERSPRIFLLLQIKPTKIKGGKAWGIGWGLELLHRH